MESFKSLKPCSLLLLALLVVKTGHGFPGITQLDCTARERVHGTYTGSTEKWTCVGFSHCCLTGPNLLHTGCCLFTTRIYYFPFAGYKQCSHFSSGTFYCPGNRECCILAVPTEEQFTAGGASSEPGCCDSSPGTIGNPRISPSDDHVTTGFEDAVTARPTPDDGHDGENSTEATSTQSQQGDGEGVVSTTQLQPDTTGYGVTTEQTHYQTALEEITDGPSDSTRTYDDLHAKHR